MAVSEFTGSTLKALPTLSMVTKANELVIGKVTVDVLIEHTEQEADWRDSADGNLMITVLEVALLKL